MEKHEKLHKQRPALWMKFFFFFSRQKLRPSLSSRVSHLRSSHLCYAFMKIFQFFLLTVVKEDARLWGENPQKTRKAALISYLGKEMSGVNGDRCGRKARNTHCPEVQQVLRLGSQKRGVRGRAWACAARGILAADSAGSRGHGACHTRTRGFLRHLIDRRFKRYCRRGLEDITGGEPLMMIGNICAVCSITTKC